MDGKIYGIINSFYSKVFENNGLRFEIGKEISTVARSIYEGAEYEIVYNQDNYRIEYSYNKSKLMCIYCSSSGLYFPNNLEEFKKAFIDRDDCYEWLGHKLWIAEKHMWIRDITKEFYVRGISRKYDTVERLIELVRDECEGYSVVLIGSSGGGYIASLLGAVLNAKYVLCFSGFFDLHIIDKDTWPLVDYYKSDSEREKYYDLLPYMEESKCTFFYLYPQKLEGDRKQAKIVEKLKNVKSFSFASAIHGVPFTNSKRLKKYDFLKIFLNLNEDELLFLADKFCGKRIFMWKWYLLLWRLAQ